MSNFPLYGIPYEYDPLNTETRNFMEAVNDFRCRGSFGGFNEPSFENL